MTDERVDELRRQLRSLGYLDAGVDRFVLGPARGTRGPVALAARSSVRVGLLGGVLLGPAAAIGVGARVPGLVSGVRDALVIALYLGLFFFVTVAIASFALSSIATLIARARRPSNVEGGERTLERLSRAAGFALTLASLAYLTLWWRNANAGFGWSAPVWTTFALLVASAISLLLGHAQRITTLAVLAVAAGPAAPLPAITNRSWRVVLAGGALAFAGAAALLLATASPGTAATPDRQPLTVMFPARVYLIALDGFDPAIFEQLRASLPNFRSAFGGTQVRLQPQDTTDPARAWTTIATGVEPEAHGVHAIETRRLAGVRGVFAGGGSVARLLGAATDVLRLTRPGIASAEERKAMTIWEVAEGAGLRTAVVNWWASWPAPPAGGILLSDRAVLRLEHGGPLDAEIAPPALYDSLRSDWTALRARAREAAARAFAARTDPEVAAILQRSAELDAIAVALAQRVGGPQLDLTVLYLPGLDIAQNALLGEGAGALNASSMASRVDAIRGYYRFLDEIVGPLLDPAAKHDVLLLTQPGRVRSSTGGVFALWPGYKEPKPEGDVFIGMMPVVVERPSPPTVLEIAPTILWRLGLPLSRELPGTPITELFRTSSTTVDRYVPTYGRPFTHAPATQGKPLDQEMIDRLRSLGYIK